VITPGPWEHDEFRPGDWRVNARDGKGGYWPVAEMNGKAEDDHDNARAIACLPELVDAVRDYLYAMLGGNITVTR